MKKNQAKNRFFWSNLKLPTFKKVRIVDVIFLAIFAVIFYFLLGFFRESGKDITVTFKVAPEEFTYLDDYPNNQFAYAFVVGDVEKNDAGRVTAEIVDINSYDIYPTKKVLYVDLKLKANYNPRTQHYLLKGKPLIFGEAFDFTFTNVKFKASVVDFPGMRLSSEITPSRTVVKALVNYERQAFDNVSGVYPFVADAMKVGEEIKDSKGNFRAKILDVSIKPAVRLITTSDGRAVTVNDPVFKEVELLVELKTKTVGEDIFFIDFQPVGLGEIIGLNLKDITVYPFVTEIVSTKPDTE